MKKISTWKKSIQHRRNTSATSLPSSPVASRRRASTGFEDTKPKESSPQGTVGFQSAPSFLPKLSLHSLQIIEAIIAHLNDTALNEEGLYRKEGAFSEQKALRKSFEEGKIVDYRCCSTHSLTSFVKWILREKHEPLLLYASYNTLVDSLNNAEEMNESLEDCIDGLPYEHNYILRILLEHLAKVSTSEGTRMNTKALSSTIGVNFCRKSERDDDQLMDAVRDKIKICSMLLEGKASKWPWVAKKHESIDLSLFTSLSSNDHLEEKATGVVEEQKASSPLKSSASQGCVVKLSWNSKTSMFAEKELREIFKGCGPISQIGINKKGNKAVMMFSSVDAVSKAMDLRPSNIKVEVADPSRKEEEKSVSRSASLNTSPVASLNTSPNASLVASRSSSPAGSPTAGRKRSSIVTSVTNFGKSKAKQTDEQTDTGSTSSSSGNTIVKVSWNKKEASWNEPKLREAFESCGKIDQIGMNKKGNKAVLMFVQSEGAMKAVNMVFDDLNVEMKKEGSTEDDQVKPKPNPDPNVENDPRESPSKKKCENTSTAVKLTWDRKQNKWAEKELYSFLTECGDIEEIGVNKKGNKALVMFSSHIGAQNALKKNSSSMKIELKDPLRSMDDHDHTEEKPDSIQRDTTHERSTTREEISPENAQDIPSPGVSPTPRSQSCPSSPSEVTKKKQSKWKKPLRLTAALSLRRRNTAEKHTDTPSTDLDVESEANIPNSTTVGEPENIEGGQLDHGRPILSHGECSMTDPVDRNGKPRSWKSKLKRKLSMSRRSSSAELGTKDISTEIDLVSEEHKSAQISKERPDLEIQQTAVDEAANFEDFGAHSGVLKLSWDKKTVKWTQDDIEKTLSCCGEIEQIGVNKKGNKAIVKFRCHGDAAKALKLDVESMKIEWKGGFEPSSCAPHDVVAKSAVEECSEEHSSTALTGAVSLAENSHTHQKLVSEDEPAVPSPTKLIPEPISPVDPNDDFICKDQGGGDSSENLQDSKVDVGTFNEDRKGDVQQRRHIAERDENTVCESVEEQEMTPKPSELSPLTIPNTPKGPGGEGNETVVTTTDSTTLSSADFNERLENESRGRETAVPALKLSWNKKEREWNESELVELFSEFGTVEHIGFNKKRNKALVLYEHAQSAQRAVDSGVKGFVKVELKHETVEPSAKETPQEHTTDITHQNEQTGCEELNRDLSIDKRPKHSNTASNIILDDYLRGNSTSYYEKQVQNILGSSVPPWTPQSELQQQQHSSTEAPVSRTSSPLNYERNESRISAEERVSSSPHSLSPRRRKSITLAPLDVDSSRSTILEGRLSTSPSMGERRHSLSSFAIKEGRGVLPILSAKDTAIHRTTDDEGPVKVSDEGVLAKIHTIAAENNSTLEHTTGTVSLTKEEYDEMLKEGKENIELRESYQYLMNRISCIASELTMSKDLFAMRMKALRDVEMDGGHEDESHLFHAMEELHDGILASIEITLKEVNARDRDGGGVHDATQMQEGVHTLRQVELEEQIRTCRAEVKSAQELMRMQKTQHSLEIEEWVNETTTLHLSCREAEKIASELRADLRKCRSQLAVQVSQSAKLQRENRELALEMSKLKDNEARLCKKWKHSENQLESMRKLASDAQLRVEKLRNTPPRGSSQDDHGPAHEEPLGISSESGGREPQVYGGGSVLAQDEIMPGQSFVYQLEKTKRDMMIHLEKQIAQTRAALSSFSTIDETTNTIDKQKHELLQLSNLFHHSNNNMELAMNRSRLEYQKLISRPAEPQVDVEKKRFGPHPSSITATNTTCYTRRSGETRTKPGMGLYPQGGIFQTDYSYNVSKYEPISDTYLQWRKKLHFKGT